MSQSGVSVKTIALKVYQLRQLLHYKVLVILKSILLPFALTTMLRSLSRSKPSPTSHRTKTASLQSSNTLQSHSLVMQWSANNSQSVLRTQSLWQNSPRSLISSIVVISYTITKPMLLRSLSNTKPIVRHSLRLLSLRVMHTISSTFQMNSEPKHSEAFSWSSQTYLLTNYTDTNKS